MNFLIGFLIGRVLVSITVAIFRIIFAVVRAVAMLIWAILRLLYRGCRHIARLPCFHKEGAVTMYNSPVVISGTGGRYALIRLDGQSSGDDLLGRVISINKALHKGGCYVCDTPRRFRKLTRILYKKQEGERHPV